MNPTGRELIDILEQVAPLEWGRFPRYGVSTFAAVVWRFDSNRTSDEQVARIIEVIRSALNVAVNMEWGLKYTGRNWVLAPIKIFQLEESGQFRTDWEVNSYIVREDSDFFKKTDADLVKIVNALSASIMNV